MFKAPWYRPEDNTEFLIYAMEQEGDFFTRQSKIHKVIKLLAAAEDPNDFETQCRIYDEVGIDSDSFTIDEVQFIIREVARRCR